MKQSCACYGKEIQQSSNKISIIMYLMIKEINLCLKFKKKTPKTAIKMKRQDSLNSMLKKIHAPLQILCYILFEYDTVQVTMINLGHWAFKKKFSYFGFQSLRKMFSFILDVTFLKQHDLFAADVLITRCLDSASKFYWFSCKLRNISCPN